MVSLELAPHEMLCIHARMSGELWLVLLLASLLVLRLVAPSRVCSAAVAADGEAVALGAQLDVAGPNAGEVELHEPAARRAIDVGGGMPAGIARAVFRGREEQAHPMNVVLEHCASLFLLVALSRKRHE